MQLAGELVVVDQRVTVGIAGDADPLDSRGSSEEVTEERGGARVVADRFRGVTGDHEHLRDAVVAHPSGDLGSLGRVGDQACRDVRHRQMARF